METREPLSQVVAAKIEDAILQRKLSAGEKLPSEAELCSQFGVSRTAVREALRMLSAKGLITVTKGKGVFVRKSFTDMITDPMELYFQLNLRRDYVIDIIRARQMMEPSIAAFAALHHRAEDVDRLRHDIEELRECNGDFRQLALLDTQFHVDIAQASQNSIMPLILNPINQLLPDIKSSVYATNKDAKDSALVWHQKIVDRIAARDAKGAAEAMTEHLKIAEEHAEIMLKAQKSIKKDPAEQ